MKIGIVGAGGFIGTHLHNYLSSDGNLVKAFFREHNSIFKDGKLNLEEIDEIDFLIWCASSINPISSQLSQEMNQREISYWKSFISEWNRFPHLLRKKIVFISSGGCVYSGDSLQFRETDEAMGSNNYGRSKVEMENVLIQNLSNFAIVRASNLYGPNQPIGRGQGVIPEWIFAIQNSLPIKVFGDLKSKRDYLHISDFLNALNKLLFWDYRGILNIGSGTPTSLEDLIAILKRYTAKDLMIELSEHRKSDRDSYFLDISKAKTAIGWEPKIDIKLGLRTLMLPNN
jgi:UDP-glucose 4-epimerase